MSRPAALRFHGKSVGGRLTLRGGAAVLERSEGERLEAEITRDGPWTEIQMAGRSGVARAACARDSRGVWVALQGRVYLFEVEHAHAGAAGAAESTGDVRAPMTGRVTSVERSVGNRVHEGDHLLTIEAMKMEFKVTAPVEGALIELRCAPGDQVELGQTIARVEPDGAAEEPA
jgi:acetyl-CoA/propionyl-CoA carboxylase, biotin carboxylase, biotin carboxyl carrier protein